MNRASGLRIIFLLPISAALIFIPENIFARAGHGGGFHGHGGGFHGGGFHGGGFHGGGFHDAGHGGGFGGHGGGFGGQGGGFGGFHNGGGFPGFRNGFGGFGERGFGFRGSPFFGGFRGFPRYGLAFDFDFFPFFAWGGYPYFFGYPWWGVPYPNYAPYDDYGPYYEPFDPDYYRYRRDYRCRPDYRHEDGCRDGSADDYGWHGDFPAQPSNGASPEKPAGQNYVSRTVEDYRKSIHTISPTTTEATNFHLVSSSASGNRSELRPAVRNAIRALRAMPPHARERQLSSGRYATFSPEEQELLRRTLARSRGE